MELANLKQPPLNATLMGCLKGASDYFDNDLSAAMLYGLSGHAFLVNVQRDLAPNGPYVWRKERFYELLRGLGIERIGEYELMSESGDRERARVEREPKESLDAGKLVMIDFLEHQLVGGFDEQGFVVLQPWGGCTPVEIKALTFGSFKECLAKEGWAHFTVLGRSAARKPMAEAARDALAFAEELVPAPEACEIDGFKIGLRAYDAGVWACPLG